MRLRMPTNGQFVSLLGFVLSLTTASPALAALIPIANSSFESPQGVGSGGSAQPDDWTLIQGSGNVWNINDFPEGFWTVPAPDGKQVLSVIGPPFAGVGIYRQSLSETFTADSVYTLTGQTGAPLGNGQYIVGLLAGGNSVVSVNGTAPDNEFGPFSLQLDTRLRPDVVGQPIGIELRSNARFTAFDFLELDAVFIPEPGNSVLVVFAALAATCAGRRHLAG